METVSKKLLRWFCPCHHACTGIIKFMTDHDVPANVGNSLLPPQEVNGYRYINIFVQYTQNAGNEPPVDLGVIFSFDTFAKLGARKYVNLEQNLPSQQNTNFIEVSGSGGWSGSPANSNTYVARFPVMGPYVEIIVYNKANYQRKVSVWGYLVS
jgi:hypothetical protein